MRKTHSCRGLLAGGPHGQYRQALLQGEDAPVQGGGVEGLVVGAQFILDAPGYFRGVQQALAGRLGLVVALGDADARPDFLLELHGGQEEVVVVAQHGVKLVEHGAGFGSLEAGIAREAAHDAPVLLLDIAGVILVGGAAAGHGDVLLLAVAEQSARDRVDWLACTPEERLDEVERLRLEAGKLLYDYPSRLRRSVAVVRRESG